MVADEDNNNVNNNTIIDTANNNMVAYNNKSVALPMGEKIEVELTHVEKVDTVAVQRTDETRLVPLMRVLEELNRAELLKPAARKKMGKGALCVAR